MYRVDFCDGCGTFTEGYKRSEGFICISCKEKGVIISCDRLSTQENLYTKSTKQLILKKFGDNRKTNIIPSGKSEKRRIPKVPDSFLNGVENQKAKKMTNAKIINKKETKAKEKGEHPVISFLKNNPDKYFTTKELWKMPKIRGKSSSQRCLSNTLLNLVKKELFYGRTIYLNGKKYSKVYSINKDLISKKMPEESCYKIYEIILNYAPVTTKEIANKLNFTIINVVQIIKSDLLDKILIWRHKTLYYYTIKGNKQQEIVLRSQFPNIKIKNQENLDSGCEDIIRDE